MPLAATSSPAMPMMVEAITLLLPSRLSQSPEKRASAGERGGGLRASRGPNTLSGLPLGPGKSQSLPTRERQNLAAR